MFNYSILRVHALEIPSQSLRLAQRWL